MQVSAVVFDLDGTLFDHTGSARDGLREWLATVEVAWSEDLAQAWFTAEERHFAAWRSGTISFAEQRRRRLREFLPLIGRPVGGDADLDEVFAGYLSGYQRAWRGFDDVGAALDAVHAAGLSTAVLTNGSETQQRAKLAHLGLLGRIGPIFTAEGLGVAKPDPRAFTAVCEHLGLPPARVLYVGDDHTVDVRAARAAGLRAVQLDRTGTGPAGEAQRITTLADLAERITLLGVGTAS